MKKYIRDMIDDLNRQSEKNRVPAVPQ